MRTITIGKENGKYFLIGEDGYSTTEEKWNTEAKAKKALESELEYQKNQGENFSLYKWIY